MNIDTEIDIDIDIDIVIDIDTDMDIDMDIDIDMNKVQDNAQFQTLTCTYRLGQVGLGETRNDEVTCVRVFVEK